MRTTAFATLFCLSASLCACGETGRKQFTIPLNVRGTPARDVSVEGGTLRLSEARIGFGPLYLCATESAETEFCATSLAEWLDATTVDGLSEDVGALGELAATTGTVQSGFYDYGISWLLTSQGPRASEGAPSGHSAVLEFVATLEDGTVLDVEANVDVEPLGPGDAAVNALRTTQALRPNDALTVVVDPSAWLRRVRIADLIAMDADGDGRVVVEQDAQAYQAILQGMTVNAPARLEWNAR